MLAASHTCLSCPAACQDVALDIRARIEEFKPYIPLIQGLRNPGMRNRHWEVLSNEININVRPKANLTFARCLEMNLQDHIESISKVAEVAGKEYSIEQVGGHQEAHPAPGPRRRTLLDPTPGVVPQAQGLRWILLSGLIVDVK